MPELTATQKYLEAAKTSAKKYRKAARSEITRRQDARAWELFSTFLGSKDAWKADANDIATWCARMASDGYSMSTINSYLSSLSYIFGTSGKGAEHGYFGEGRRIDNPAKSYLVQSTMRGIRRVHGRAPKKSLPLQLATLDRLISLQPHNLIGARNRAIFSIMWAAALNVTELLDLRFVPGDREHGYVEIHRDGLLLVIRRRYSRRSGYEWRTCGIPLRKSNPEHCPTALLMKWQSHLHAETAYLFPIVRYNRIQHQNRMRHVAVNAALKPYLRFLGLPEDQYTTRSFRKGCLEWLATEGVSPGRIMQHAGVHSIETVMQSIRSVSAVYSSPLSDTSWSGTGNG